MEFHYHRRCQLQINNNSYIFINLVFLSVGRHDEVVVCKHALVLKPECFVERDPHLFHARISFRRSIVHTDHCSFVVKVLINIWEQWLCITNILLWK